MVNNYDKLLNITKKILNKNKLYTLYDCYDIVHCLYLTTPPDANMRTVVQMLYSIARKGCLSWAALVHDEELSPLDEVYCKKCKGLKYYIYDFYSQLREQNGHTFNYYSRVCKDCCNAKKSIYKKTEAYKTIHKKANNKWRILQKETLSDSYIRNMIIVSYKKKGITVTSEDIPYSEIVERRNKLFKKRANQQKKKNNGNNQSPLE